MPDWVRRPSPAMIVASLALFVSLGGTGYAVVALPTNSVGQKQIRKAAVTSPKIKNNTIRSNDVRNGTIVGHDLRAGTLGPREIAESKLGPVPHAVAAETVGGLSATQLKVSCLAFGDAASSAGACIEVNSRPAMTFHQAVVTCGLVGRRLPAYDQLSIFYSSQRPLAQGGEWTRDVDESDVTAGQPDALVIQSDTGSNVTSENAAGPATHAFRCAATPTN